MKKLSIIILLCIACSAFAQKQKLITQPELDNIIKEKIDDFRQQRNLTTLVESEVLRLSSQHHSYYMATTQIVSHYQTMNLVSMSSIYSPRKRIDHFSASQVSDDINFSEIVVGIKSNNHDLQVLADEFMSAIMNSENILILLNKQVKNVGLSTVKRKNRYYLTLSFALENDNILALD